MTSQGLVFTLVRFLHDLSTAVWIGGMVAIAASLLPTVRANPSPHTRALGLQVQKRMSALVYVSMVVLAVTGILLARRSPQVTRLFSWATAYARVLSIKHLLYIAMVAVSVVRSVVVRRDVAVAPPAEAEGAPASEPSSAEPTSRADRVRAVMLFVNVALGVGVLFLSALNAALGRMPR